MPISELYELDGVTVGATELSIPNGGTTLQALTTDALVQVWLDHFNIAKSDYFRLRIYEKVRSGGTQRVAFQTVLPPIAPSQILTFPPLMLMHGWDVTLQKVAGTDRAFDASIRAVTGSGLTEYDGMDAVTVGATELSIVSGTTTLQTVGDDGIYQLWVDPVTNMAKGDEFIARIYEKVEETGGTKRLVWEATLSDVPTELLVSPQLLLMHGWDMTLKKVAGTDRAFDASIRRAA
jgi:hypothetical protein